MTLNFIWILLPFSYVNCGYLPDIDLAFLEPKRFTVNASAPVKGPDCRLTLSEPLQVCRNRLIFDGSFMGEKIDDKAWEILQYIPGQPDYEFCSYEKNNDAIFIKDGNLVIRPIPATKNEEVSGSLDLRRGCTRKSENECFAKEDSGFILPPVKSAKMRSNMSFKYGVFKIRAKLPAGDWIYPEIYLESNKDENKKIRIAYARGNKYLLFNAVEGSNVSDLDIGGHLLSGGPILSFNEPDRSKYLKTRRANKPFFEDYHEYAIVWKPDQISLFVDQIAYGVVRENVSSLFDEPMHIVLGVGVGGLTDFPDDYVSSNNMRKPWKDADRLIYKNFFKKRYDWLPTWTREGSSLKVKYVDVSAL